MVDNKERDPKRDGGLTTSETNKDSLPKQGGPEWVSSWVGRSPPLKGSG